MGGPPKPLHFHLQSLLVPNAKVLLVTEMRPLLQHASRALIASHVVVAPVSRSLGSHVSRTPSVCLRCQYRAASTALRKLDRVQLSSALPERWSRRSLWSSRRCLEERKPSDPIPMPPPSSPSKPVQRAEDRAPENFSSLEGQERLQEESGPLLGSQVEGKKPEERPETVPEGRPATEAQERLQEQERVADNIARVPDEHLPSHRERQRWDLSKRLSEVMDELLPKLAVVTQKVNTYTGTDYSGVEALRREIKEQESLVKARRAAIDSSKQALDTALAHQASSQKEVVALLERKHSWSAGDLERYMSLIRSEHINDQAVREAKDAVANAENALEEARSQLEKRERAQYHEEQIWSDTIRRNSTWVTFGLMGVNIFLLLLSLAILEPWRRRRMVREIKNALEAHKLAIEAPLVSASTVTATTTPAVAPVSAQQDLAIAEEKLDKPIEAEMAPADGSPAAPIVEQSPAIETDDALLANPSSTPDAVLDSILEPTIEPAVPGAAPLVADDAEIPPQESINIAEEVSESGGIRGRLEAWQKAATAVAQDVISDRTITLRRIDYTTAILQGAAAGAVITAAIIAMLRAN
ncbi:Mdm33 family-domain-containing protein, partial [Pyrenochaeta sp. MPI-SDFR-AT-0127]